MIEFSNTDDLFTKPAKKQTETTSPVVTVDSGVRYGQSQSYKHISGQFNAELESIRTQVMTWAAWWSSSFLMQSPRCITRQRSGEAGDRRRQERQHDGSGIDEACVRIIAKRQPTASDLLWLW